MSSSKRWSLGSRQTQICPTLLRRIFDSDQSMYPSALTFSRLQSWVDACPELCLSFDPQPPAGDDSQNMISSVAVFIILPMVKSSWEDLLVGRLKEADVDPEKHFPHRDNETKTETGKLDVGLHIFHVERFDSGKRTTGGQNERLTEGILNNAVQIVAKKQWNLLGFSAIAATEAGRKVCKRMGFKPTGYKEIIVGPDGSIVRYEMSKL